MDPFLARYPFLPEAAEHVAREVTLEDLVEDRVYVPARRRGRDRVVEALEEGEIRLPEATSDAEVLRELLSHAVARILVSVLDDDYVTRRVALAEAERVKRFLDDEAPPRFLEVADELGMDLEPEDAPERREDGADARGWYRMHFGDYLRAARKIKNREWKLINRPLDDGDLVLPQPTVARLLQETLRARILDELPLGVPDDLQEGLEAELEDVREAAEERKSQFDASEGFGEVDMERFPPCMKTLIGQLESGSNMAHSGRFAVAAFLSNIGLDTEGILEVFARTPDFREDIARYQIEHITGEGSTSGREYTTPSCDWMKTNGICYDPDRWCKHTRDDGTRSVTNPLSYYRWALKRKEWAKRQREDGDDEDEDEAGDEDGDGGDGDGPDDGDPDDAPPADPFRDDEDVPESIRAQSSGW